MKKNKAIKNSGLGSGLSSLLGSELEKKSILSEENVTEKSKIDEKSFPQEEVIEKEEPSKNTN